MFRLVAISAALVGVLLAGSASPPLRLKIEGKEALSLGQLEGTTLDAQGKIRLKLAATQDGTEQTVDRTFGSYIREVELPAGASVWRVTVEGLDAPLVERQPLQREPPGGTGFPSVATQVVTQVRFLRGDDKWGPWTPRNLLGGGDFHDDNRNGIPDWTWLFRFRTAGNVVFADWPPGDPKALLHPAWGDIELPPSADFVDSREAPVGARQSLRLERHTDDGQDTSEMRTDLVPPGKTLTVSGWNRYDVGAGLWKGVMARFHEFDAAGKRIKKFVLLGDDEFHQPTGSSPWRWRALTFTSTPATTRLGIYPIRMIHTKGRAWAANWEVREGAVYSEGAAERVVFQDDFTRPDNWEAGHPAVTQAVPARNASSYTLVMKPKPMTHATYTQKNYIPIQQGKLYAFRIAMHNDVPRSYDSTHDTWVSCYLEFYDREKRFIDYVKAMVFRPVLESAVGAAMVAPEGAQWARFMLVASHITYLVPTDRITGTMTASFEGLRLEESAYDLTWTARQDGPQITLAQPVRAKRMQVRSWLLTRDRRTNPSIGGYTIEYESGK